jgi:putative serine protease PepD
MSQDVPPPQSEGRPTEPPPLGSWGALEPPGGADPHGYGGGPVDGAAEPGDGPPGGPPQTGGPGRDLSSPFAAARPFAGGPDESADVPVAWQQPGDVLGRAEGRSSFPVGLLVVATLLLALVAGLLGGAAGSFWADRLRSGSGQSISLPEPAKGTTQRDRASVAGVAQRVLPSVVLIKVSGADGTGTGSGFVIRPDGYIVTNNHVVAGAGDDGEIKVQFSDGTQRLAKVVGRDESYDLAAIKVDQDGLPTLDFGDSDSVVVGDEVIAFGAPLGLGGTVTTGIVSALNRPVSAGASNDAPAFINAIQTDAAINPGNSGGPLVNLRGEVVAVNSAIARIPGAGSLGSQSGNIGLGFAIPSRQARRTVQQLIQDGKATHPVIGVLLDRSYTGEGVRVASKPQGGQQPVTPGGPAELAGIRPGDVITAFAGRPISDPDALVVSIRAKAPGETVELTVRSGRRERTVRMTLQAATE